MSTSASPDCDAKLQKYLDPDLHADAAAAALAEGKCLNQWVAGVLKEGARENG